MPRHPHLRDGVCEGVSAVRAKAERKDRTKEEVDQIICWLTGYTARDCSSRSSRKRLRDLLRPGAGHESRTRALIKGVVCGVRVEEVDDPLMRKIRYLDKLIDELAKGKAMEKILREAPSPQ